MQTKGIATLEPAQMKCCRQSCYQLQDWQNIHATGLQESDPRAMDLDMASQLLHTCTNTH
eukprot:2729222-Lingulodinium_polyedra.AAC.1